MMSGAFHPNSTTAVKSHKRVWNTSIYVYASICWTNGAGARLLWQFRCYPIQLDHRNSASRDDCCSHSTLHPHGNGKQKKSIHLLLPHCHSHQHNTFVYNLNGNYSYQWHRGITHTTNKRVDFEFAKPLSRIEYAPSRCYFRPFGTALFSIHHTRARLCEKVRYTPLVFMPSSLFTRFFCQRRERI